MGTYRSLITPSNHKLNSHGKIEFRTLTSPRSNNLPNLNDQLLSPRMTTQNQFFKSTKFSPSSNKELDQQNKSSRRLMLGVVLYHKIKNFYKEPPNFNTPDINGKVKLTTNRERKKINLSEHFLDSRFLTLNETKAETKDITNKQTGSTLQNYEDLIKTTDETTVSNFMKSCLLI